MTLDDLFALCSPEPNTGCWLWTGRTSVGYGSVAGPDGVAWAAHRLAYTLAIGDIAPRMVIDHLCGEPTCLRPDHLEQVTRAENTRRGQPQGCIGRGRPGAFVYDGGRNVRGSILVQLTAEEGERLRAAAAAAGVGLGPWLRALGLREEGR